MKKAKYFKTLPDQEYVFKTFFTCGKNEGLCCSDCGTYITNVVQVIGKADRMVYNLGTTCCDKISKDRSVFLTPLSVQRKKLFITEFKKNQKIRKELEEFAETWGGAVLKFADIDYDYQQNMRVTLFIYCKNGYLLFNRFESAQRCFTGLKELLSGYQMTFDCGDFLDGTWKNYDSYISLKKMVEDAYSNYNKGSCNGNQIWYCYFKTTEYFDKWIHFEDTENYKKPMAEFGWNKLKTHPQIF